MRFLTYPYLLNTLSKAILKAPIPSLSEGKAACIDYYGMVVCKYDNFTDIY